MKHGIPASGEALESVAVKDVNLVYRACSQSFARALGFHSPRSLIGKTDEQVFPTALAREFSRVEQDVLDQAQAAVSLHDPIDADWRGKIFVRTPLMDQRGGVSGIDIKLIETYQTHSPIFTRIQDAGRFRLIHDDSQQPLMVHAGDKVLYANQSWMKAYEIARSELLQIRSVRKFLSASLHAIQSQECEWLGHAATLVLAYPLSTDRASIRTTGLAADQASDFAYRTLLDNTPQGVLVVVKNVLVYANRAAANILNYTDPKELTAVESLAAVLQISDWDGNGAPAELPISHRQSQIARRVEVPGIQKDGRVIVLQAQAQATQWRQQQAILIGFYDNTEQALSEQMLSESEQRFRHYAYAAGDFFWETDASLKFTYLSEQFEEVLGIQSSSLIGGTTQDLVRRLSQDEASDSWSAQLDRLLHHQSFADFEFKWQREDGDSRVIRYSGVAVFAENGDFLGYRGSGRDVTGAHRIAERVAYHASHDSLTGLVNRRRFEELVKEAMHGVREEHQTHALCFLDLDNFKIVNDTCGHIAGDELLRQLSTLLNSHVRKSDVLARIGGDEFGVLLYSCKVDQALRLANQLRSEVESFQFLWRDNRFSIGVSIGLVVVDESWQNVSSLFNAADSACYLAKDEGRNQVVVYQDKVSPAIVRTGETHWIEEIRSAIADNRLKLAQQPISQVADNADNQQQFEIFTRLVAANGNIVNPQAFLPAAERYGLAVEVDSMVVDMTLNFLAGRPQLLERMNCCSINLSAQSVGDEHFLDSLMTQIEHCAVPASKLCFELTETATIANLSAAEAFMNKLSKTGCHFALDKFGSGLSSFAYLKKLPVEYLKIDGLLVRDMLEDPLDHAMVKAINEIGHTLNCKTVACFVETEQLLQAVTEIKIDYVQGYHIGQPKIIV